MLTIVLAQEELGYLKSLWDMAAAVLHTFQAWSGTLWGAIHVEGLMEECKQLGKEMKGLNKAVRGGVRGTTTGEGQGQGLYQRQQTGTVGALKCIAALHHL